MNQIDYDDDELEAPTIDLSQVTTVEVANVILDDIVDCLEDMSDGIVRLEQDQQEMKEMMVNLIEELINKRT